MNKTLKCNRCNIKYIIYPVSGYITLNNKKVLVKHYNFVLCQIKKNLLKYEFVKANGGTQAEGINYDDKGRVICNCPKCNKQMIAV